MLEWLEEEGCPQWQPEADDDDDDYDNSEDDDHYDVDAMAAFYLQHNFHAGPYDYDEEFPEEFDDDWPLDEF